MVLNSGGNDRGYLPVDWGYLPVDRGYLLVDWGYLPVDRGYLSLPKIVAYLSCSAGARNTLGPIKTMVVAPLWVT